MKKLTAKELKKAYIDFFVEHGHTLIKGASLIPENDPTVLFTTAGMHPLVPYLMGESHPAGHRLVDCQKCLRTGDIDEVGDASHLTFFQMMGNWSLNHYFKETSIPLSHEFLTKVLEIPQERISVTVFEGEEGIPRDNVSADTWRSLGYPDERIYFYPRKENWWGPAGVTGPCGPDTEIFFDTGKEPCGPDCQPSCGCGKYVEIWNNVFMEFYKEEDGTYRPLGRHNVDTGLGLERVLCLLNGVDSVYDTELFKPIINRIEQTTGINYDTADEESRRAIRIICDHMRSTTFLLGDERGVVPSNVDQGYVLRRLIRRTMRHCMKLGIDFSELLQYAEILVADYQDEYPELAEHHQVIIDQLAKEIDTFSKTIDKGTKLANKIMDGIPEGGQIDGEKAFHLYDTYGFPLELTCELASERGLTVDTEGYEKFFAEHQEKSRAGAEQRFKGGLADNSEQTTRLHTATHLLHGALRKVLGDSVFQRGSNITAERLRFDFNFERKMTPEEIAEVEAIVNKAIQEGVEVECREMPIEEARAMGAVGIFDDKYGDRVRVYIMGDYDTELCGGPHAANTAELKAFKIQKEKSSSAGVRRIVAVIGDAALQ